MIRSFIRCTRMYKHLLVAQKNGTIPAMHHILEARMHKSHSKQILTTEQSETIPLNIDHEPITRLISFLHKKLNCTKEQAAEICIAYPDLVGKKLSEATKNLELLLEKGVRPNIILDNPRMLTRNHSKIGAYGLYWIMYKSNHFRSTLLEPQHSERHETERYQWFRTTCSSDDIEIIKTEKKC